MRIMRGTSLGLDYLCDLHKVLMKDLLPVREQGLVRTAGVNIDATRYKPPLADPARLHTEIKLHQRAAYLV